MLKRAVTVFLSDLCAVDSLLAASVSVFWTRSRNEGGCVDRSVLGDTTAVIESESWAACLFSTNCKGILAATNHFSCSVFL